MRPLAKCAACALVQNRKVMDLEAALEQLQSEGAARQRTMASLAAERDLALSSAREASDRANVRRSCWQSKHIFQAVEAVQTRFS